MKTHGGRPSWRPQPRTLLYSAVRKTSFTRMRRFSSLSTGCRGDGPHPLGQLERRSARQRWGIDSWMRLGYSGFTAVPVFHHPAMRTTTAATCFCCPFFLFYSFGNNFPLLPRCRFQFRPEQMVKSQYGEPGWLNYSTPRGVIKLWCIWGCCCADGAETLHWPCQTNQSPHQ